MEIEIKGKIKIKAYTDKEGNIYTEEEFIDKFLQWIEENKFEFLGRISEIK